MRPSTDDSAPAGRGLAVTAEALYLANLLLLPAVSFVGLAVLFLRRKEDTPPLAAAHVEQTFTASLWAGVLLVAVNLLILALGGYRGIHSWVLVILYFTVCHSTLVLFGIVGLAKALAGQCWRFPVVGRPLPPGCPAGGPHG
jgi:uncharacterized Tic20 family protein